MSKNKGYIVCGEDFELNNKEDFFYLDENSQLGRLYLDNFPYVDFKQEGGVVIDIIVLERPPINIEPLRINKITQSKQLLVEFLETHPLLYNNEHYSVTQEKQALLTSAISAYQLKVQAGVPATLKWNTTGDICREFTLEEITGLVIAITDYVQPRVEKQQILEVQIKNAQTLEELEAIEINYEVI